MLQRIQTLYLIISCILTAVLPFVFPVWHEAPEVPVYFTTSIIYMALFGLVSITTIASIFNFKKRQTQFVLNRLSIILNFILLGFFVYRTLSLSGETEVSEKGIGMLIPIFSIVFLVLANKAIRKDEDLVKSADRLR